MTKGLFETRRNEVEIVLTKLKILSERNRFINYSSYDVSMIRDISEKDLWQFFYENKIFDFCLVDGSIIQYRADFQDKQAFNYCYYENPYFQERTIEAIAVEFSNESEEGFVDDEVILEAYYSQSLPSEKKQYISIRYDYNPNQYCTARHPASHLHINSNLIRLGTRKIMNPLSFIFFVLRQCYPDSWQELAITKNSSLLCGNISTGLEDIPAQYYQEADHMEVYLV